MKLSKKLMVILAVGVLVFSAAQLALAATPQPADNMQQEQQAEEAVNTSAAVSQETNQFVNKKYLTKGGAAFWFIFTIILNGALSFWIGNRFYRLARKDNHVAAEIRALRRDVEDKLVKNVGGFSEQEFEIKNHNESLASEDEEIKTPDKQPVMRDISDEEESRFRQWEEAQSKHRTNRERPRSVVREELKEELEDVKKIKRKNYQPKRQIAENDFEDDDDLGETKEIKLTGDSVKSKAKEILNDIFPFKED